MSEADIRSVMAQAMSAEDRRREVAGASPGLGALLPLEQPPSGAGTGIWDVDMPVIGEGYDQQAEIAAAVHKAYGEARPVYAGPAVAGDSYVLGVSQPALRHVTNSAPMACSSRAPAHRRRMGSRWCRRHPGRRCCRICWAGSAGRGERPRPAYGAGDAAPRLSTAQVLRTA
jgi:hypothetical protein